MKRENKIKSSLFYDKHLFLFYMKKNILSVKFAICFIFLFIPIFQTLSELEYIIYLGNANIRIQSDLDEVIFWQRFIGIYSRYLTLIPVILTADIVSGEFSNKSAMIIYATESRYKILTIKLLCVIFSLLILVLFYFSAFLIVIFIKTELLISINIFMTGFLFIFVELILYSSLTFLISALTRNIAISFIFPFFYLITQGFLEEFELGLFSINSYLFRVLEFFENLFFYERIDLNAVTFFCLVIFFGASILIMLITFYTFNQLDIRID